MFRQQFGVELSRKTMCMSTFCATHFARPGLRWRSHVLFRHAAGADPFRIAILSNPPHFTPVAPILHRYARRGGAFAPVAEVCWEQISPRWLLVALCRFRSKTPRPKAAYSGPRLLPTTPLNVTSFSWPWTLDGTRYALRLRLTCRRVV
jgi:hypothetical protein